MSNISLKMTLYHKMFKRKSGLQKNSLTQSLKPLCQRVSRPKGVRKFHAALYQKLRGILASYAAFDTMLRVG